MKMIKAFKYKLKTNTEEEQKLSEVSGCTRFVWNKFLALNLDRLNNKHKMLWYNEMSFWLTLYKSSTESFLKVEVSSTTLATKSSILNLD